ncbi:hypothetical protein BGZ49_008402 [Haplosporangium sp. Z 27]|nr:hypothetical protein BGZ49_008402 [Haplosporangium sp. Z 27]
MEGGSFDSTGHINQPDVEESVALFIFLACVSVMSVLFGRKTATATLSSLNYARSLVASLFISSWIFSFMAALLASTNNENQVSCTISNFVCIFLYAGSKVLIYLFLVERVYIVTAVGVSRWNSRMFKFNVALLSPFAAIVVLAIKFRVSLITEDGECVIGLTTEASSPLIAYDVLINIWLTALFMRALISSTSQLQGPSKIKLRTVALRTFYGSILSLFLSTSNIVAIVVFDGRERGVLCLALCALDVTLNAVTIYWVTSPCEHSGLNNARKKVNIPDNNGSIPVVMREKQVSQLESHVSVSIESYVEEYHRLHIANRASLDRGY